MDLYLVTYCDDSLSGRYLKAVRTDQILYEPAHQLALFLSASFATSNSTNTAKTKGTIFDAQKTAPGEETVFKESPLTLFEAPPPAMCVKA